MLKHFMTKALEVSEIVGVRLVLVHAKDEHSKTFYRHHGFIESPIDPLTLMMSLTSTGREKMVARHRTTSVPTMCH